MQTVVIIFLLSVGAVCIFVQAAITFLHSRPERASVGATAEPEAKKPAPRTAAAKTAAAQAAQETGEGEQASTDAAGEESTKDRLLRRVTNVFGSKNARSAKIGTLGLVLMLIAVALVIDISLSFTIAT